MLVVTCVMKSCRSAYTTSRVQSSLTIYLYNCCPCVRVTWRFVHLRQVKLPEGVECKERQMTLGKHSWHHMVSFVLANSGLLDNFVYMHLTSPIDLFGSSRVN